MGDGGYQAKVLKCKTALGAAGRRQKAMERRDHQQPSLNTERGSQENWARWLPNTNDVGKSPGVCVLPDPRGNGAKGNLRAGQNARAVSPVPPRPASRPAPPRPSAPVRGGRAAAVAAAASSGHFAPRGATRGDEPGLEEARARGSGGLSAFAESGGPQRSPANGVGGPFPGPCTMSWGTELWVSEGPGRGRPGREAKRGASACVVAQQKGNADRVAQAASRRRGAGSRLLERQAAGVPRGRGARAVPGCVIARAPGRSCGADLHARRCGRIPRYSRGRGGLAGAGFRVSYLGVPRARGKVFSLKVRTLAPRRLGRTCNLGDSSDSECEGGCGV